MNSGKVSLKKNKRESYCSVLTAGASGVVAGSTSFAGVGTP